MGSALELKKDYRRMSYAEIVEEYKDREGGNFIDDALSHGQMANILNVLDLLEIARADAKPALWQRLGQMMSGDVEMFRDDCVMDWEREDEIEASYEARRIA